VPHEWLAEIVPAAAYDLAGWSGGAADRRGVCQLGLLTPFCCAGRAALDLDRGNLGRGAGPRSLAGAAASSPCRSWSCGRGTLRRTRHCVGPPFRLLPLVIVGQSARRHVWAGLCCSDGRGDAGREPALEAPVGRFLRPPPHCLRQTAWALSSRSG
jgi:hypothetical protein